MLPAAPLSSWMPSPRPRLTLRPSGFSPFVLARIFDHEVAVLGPNAQPVMTDPNREWDRAMSQPHLALPQTRAGAERVFGPSSGVRGDKGSFRFPLILSATTNAGTVRYAMVLRDVKGTIELPFFRLHEEPVPAPSVPEQDPGPAGLSPSAISGLTCWILGYLEGRGQSAEPGPFCHVVRASLIIYGYADGEFFERSYDSHEDYEHAHAAIAERIADAGRKRRRQYIRSLFASCESPAPA